MLLLCALALLFGVRLGSQQRQPSQKQPPADPHAAIRANNLGAAYLNQQRTEQALAQFKQAQAADPKLAVARVNEAIALLNLQRIEPARALLSEIVAQDSKNVRAWYNLGLLEKNSGDAEKALAAFEKAAALDPGDPDTHYFIGTLHSQLQKYDDAIAAFQRAIKSNPFHVSAEFGLARAQQRLGNAEQARLHLARFQHLNTEKLGAPMSLAYGDQGKYSLAETVTLPPTAAPPPIPIKFTLVPESASGLKVEWLNPNKRKAYEGMTRVAPKHALPPMPGTHCLFDYDNDGDGDVFLAVRQIDEVGARLFQRTKNQYVDATPSAGFEVIQSVDHCAAGDYDNDGWTDLALGAVGGTAIYRNLGNGTFQNVTAKVGLPTDLSTSALTWVDLDHDGDLDLYVSHAVPPTRDTFWRNNGNGTFSDWTEPSGLLIGGGWSGKTLAMDVNNDRAIDLIKAGDRSSLDQFRAGPPDSQGRLPRPARPESLGVYLNPREGKFKRTDSVTSGVPPEQYHVRSLDFDRDGWMDLAIAHMNDGLTLWRNVGGVRFEQVKLPVPSRRWVSDLVVLDYDNDGWQDLAFVDDQSFEDTAQQQLPQKFAPRLNLLRNLGGSRFELRSKGTALAELSLSLLHLSAGDVDSDGDPDLLVSVPFAVTLLRNDGGNKNNWLKLSLKGLADNKSAIGTKVEVFAGATYQKFEVTTPNDLLIGLGQEKQADVVRLLWPTGVLQDEVNLAANQRHEIMQIDRRGSSCPVLFAWNGSRYEFIADAIGPGIVGHWVAPGLRNTSDPTEYIKVPGSLLRERRGPRGERLLSFRFAEPMEEIVYLDQLRLFAIDHPSGTDVNPSERFYASGPPFPTGEPVFTLQSNARPPVSASDHHGRDVTALLRERDRRYVSDFADAPYKGFAELHWIEFDLGEAAQTTAQDPVGAPLAAPRNAAHPRGFGVRLDAALPSRHGQTNGAQQAAPLRLLLHGYTDYFTATSVYAAHQGGLTAIVPYVEALTQAGEWVRIADDMGFPAGLARTMVADLTGKLPLGTRRIRISTNLKVYWDQILIDTTPEGTPHRISEAPLAGARAGYLGYPREIRGTPASDIRYDYHTVSATGPYARAAGHYTRYGDVRALIEGADDRFVLMGSGDEVAVDFDAAALPPVPEGWTRDWFFYVDGFAKDMDFYAAHPFTVTPLPYHAMPGYPYGDEHRYPNRGAHLEDQLELNTRAVSGRPASSYRYQYREPRATTPAPPQPR
ncbi:MAG: FG-GAP-like repeat-containing protein [Candidatus Acidiferrales bacterium]